MNRISLTPLRIVLLLGFIAATAIVFMIYVSPNLGAWQLARRLGHALDGARSVTLEEFSTVNTRGSGNFLYRSDLVHQRILASPPQIAELRQAMNAWVAPFPLRIVRADGSEFLFEICFLCSNMRMTGEGGGPMPTSWVKPLEAFFTRVGMAPLDDYKEKEAKHPERPLPQE